MQEHVGQYADIENLALGYARQVAFEHQFHLAQRSLSRILYHRRVDEIMHARVRFHLHDLQMSRNEDNA